MAAIADEHLPVIVEEKLTAIKLEQGQSLIVAGNQNAWLKIERYFSEPLAQVKAPEVEKEEALIKAPPAVLTRFYNNNDGEKLPSDARLAIYLPVTEQKPKPEIAAPTLKVETPQQKVEVKNITGEIDLKKHEEFIAGVPSIPAKSIINQANSQPEHQASVPQPEHKTEPAIDRQSPSIEVAQKNNKSLEPNSTNQPEALATIKGQIEFSGGLAYTGSSTKLVVYHAYGGEMSEGQVELPEGRFTVNYPAERPGTVIVQLINENGYTLGRGEYSLVQSEEFAKGDVQADFVKIVVEPLESSVRGILISGYSYGNSIIPARGEVFGPASNREQSDRSGRFRFQRLSHQSQMVMEAYAPEHLTSRMLADSAQVNTIEIYSNKMIESLFQLNGIEPNSGKGVIFGKISRNKKGLKNVSVTLIGGRGTGPIYFNEILIPDKNLKATSEAGYFAFLNVDPGVSVVTAKLGERELPSTVLSVAEGAVSPTHIKMKQINMVGSLFDGATGAPISGEMTVLGTKQLIKISSNGFGAKFPHSDGLIFAELRAGENMMPARTVFNRSRAQQAHAFTVSRDWLKSRIGQAKLQTGIVLGLVAGGPFKVSVESPDRQLIEANVNYFNTQGESSIDPDDSSVGFSIQGLNSGLYQINIQNPSGDIVATRLALVEDGYLSTLTADLVP
ncbi:MAG: hypothetical protein IT289_03195 [Oligoflexia bacterium]|nr:hypothetical protein [Oligoflexia bacterium]